MCRAYARRCLSRAFSSRQSSKSASARVPKLAIDDRWRRPRDELRFKGAAHIVRGSSARISCRASATISSGMIEAMAHRCSDYAKVEVRFALSRNRPVYHGRPSRAGIRLAPCARRRPSRHPAEFEGAHQLTLIGGAICSSWVRKDKFVEHAPGIYQESGSGQR